MPAGSDSKEPSLKPRIPPKKGQVAKLAAHHARVVAKAKLAKSKKAVLEAGTKARDAAIKVDELCAAVEETPDQNRHRELLARALYLSIEAISALRTVQPITDLDGWIEGSLNQDVATSLTRARELRGRAASFGDFRIFVANSMRELGFAAPATRCTVERLANVSLPDAPPLEGLSETVARALDVLARELLVLRAGGSLVVGWGRARAAQDVLEGAVVLLAPSLVDESSPLRPTGDNEPACLSVIGGAGLVGRACTRTVLDGDS